jgi:hypothetical protein
LNPQPQISFDLLTNANDSLKRAVQLLAWKDFTSEHATLKHAITNAAHAIELLLKERLRRAHPAFVWQNVDKYPSLQAATVTSDIAISRLKSLCGVAFTPSDEKNLLSLRTTRNAIEHYEWRASEKEAKIIVGNALSFAFDFAAENLGADLVAEFKKDDTWRMLIQEMYEFVRAHGARIEARLGKQGEFSACCDECGEQTVTLGGSCELCGHWQEVDDGRVY